MITKQPQPERQEPSGSPFPDLPNYASAYAVCIHRFVLFTLGIKPPRD